MVLWRMLQGCVILVAGWVRASPPEVHSLAIRTPQTLELSGLNVQRSVLGGLLDSYVGAWSRPRN